MEVADIRRVYTPELAQRLGCSTKWILELERRGTIPRGRTDPGGRRKFWPSDVALAIVKGEPAAETATAQAA